MIIKKSYIIFKPKNIRKLVDSYNYDELKIEVTGIYLFGIIPIYKKHDILFIIRNKKSYRKPKIIKLK